ncbi:MAG: HEAT repeat domain-containing protein [Phycisphaerales bacterium]
MTRSRLSTSLCLLVSLVVLDGCGSTQTAEAQPVTETGAPVPTAIEMSSLRERALEKLNDAAFSSSALMRANAIEGLHAVPTRAEQVVRMGLQDDNVGVRYTAATTVGLLKLNTSRELVRPLVQDPDARVRAAAIFALNQTGAQVNLNPLASILETRDARQRANVVWLLGEMGNRSAIPMLKDAASKPTWGTPNEERMFRLQVSEALVKLGEMDSISTVRAALYPSSESEFELAVLAAQIIGEVQDRGASAQLVNLIQAQVAGTSARNPEYIYPAELRLAAAAALAKMGFDDGTYVADLYAEHEQDSVRAQAALLYAEIGHAENLPKLKALMADASPIVQVHAAAAILKIVEA